MCLELYWSNLLGVARPPAQKKQPLSKKWPKMSNFGRKQCIVGEQSGTRNPPLNFWGCIVKKKGFFWSFWVQNLFSWFFCAYTIVYSYTGEQHCSAATPQSRQKYSKIGRIPGFLMVWEKGETPYPYFGARESQEEGNICQKSSIGKYTGVQHCSAGPAQRRQEYPKNRPNFRAVDICGHNSGRRTPPLF